MWPKGYVAPPTFSQSLEFFFRDNRGALLLASGFLVTLLYYLIAWSAVGSDPARGVLMALYEPPANLSPAAMRYLMRMGYDNKTFAAAILDMAVRGFLKIADESGAYRLTLTGKDERVLTLDEKQIASTLFEGRREVLLQETNHRLIKSAMIATQKVAQDRRRKDLLPRQFTLSDSRFFHFLAGSARLFRESWLCWNDWRVVHGLVAHDLDCRRLRAGPRRFDCLEGSPSWRQFRACKWRQSFPSHSFRPPFSGRRSLRTVFFSQKLTSLSFGVFLIATGILHGVFVHLMKAPTFAGRRLMDQVEGFKLFLASVDGDRLNRPAPPQQTPEVFEKFLPYALALDVEQAWANKFSGILVAAGTAPAGSGAGYTLSFYSGSSWNTFSGAGFVSSFGSSLTSAISSASSAPGSGGGGRSGGSGGGGGGGGGGGW